MSIQFRYAKNCFVLLFLLSPFVFAKAKMMTIIQDRTTYVPPSMREGDYGNPNACGDMSWTHRGDVCYKCGIHVLDSIYVRAVKGGDSTSCDVILKIYDGEKLIILGYGDGRIIDYRNGIRRFYLLEGIFDVGERLLRRCGDGKVKSRYP